MIQETQKLYKLMVLYMLERADTPVANSRIVDFFTSGEYANYFTVQEVLSSLEADDFIVSSQKQNLTLYSLTERGELSSKQFKDEISDSFRESIDLYLSKNMRDIKNEVSITSEYFKNKNGEYTAICRIKEKNVTLIDLSLSVPLEENAKNICENWKDKSGEVYKAIIQNLL